MIVARIRTAAAAAALFLMMKKEKTQWCLFMRQPWIFWGKGGGGGISENCEKLLASENFPHPLLGGDDKKGNKELR